MPKVSKELSKKRGENIKALLKQHKQDGWNQTKLAEKLGMEPSNLSAKLNGVRPIYEDEIRRIAECFPGVREDWLMGYARFPTWGEEITGVVNQANHEGELLNTGLYAFAILNGYSISQPNWQDIKQVEAALSALKQGYTISKNGKTISLSLDEFRRLQNKICDHIGTELNYLFQEKGV